MQTNIFRSFFNWYNKNYNLQIKIAAGLFLLQLVHLVWLTSDVVLYRLAGVSFFPKGAETFLAFFDYTEIPAIISVSLVYVNDIILGKNISKSWLYLFLLNSQWLHIFWITDEIILANFTGTAPVLIPIWLSWMAIFVDYLELPVMYDTVKRVLQTRKLEEFKEGE